MSKFGPHLLASRERRQAARAARRNGDQARERHQWRKAAQDYADYLKVFSADFPLWVQLGHMHKEAGSFDLADQAYAKARALKPEDGDLLLSLGHLRKQEGRLKEAAAFYLECVRLSSHPMAIQELGSGLLSSLTDSDAMANLYERDIETEKALALHLEGTALLMAYGITHVGGGALFSMSGHDPQIHFSVNSGLSDAPVIMIEMAFERGPAFNTTSGTLFIDYGQGFQAKNRFSLTYPDEKTCIIRAFLAVPRSIKALRWDPIEGKGAEISLLYIRASAMSSVDELLDKVFEGQDSKAAGDSTAVDSFAVTPAQLGDGMAPFFAKSMLSEVDRRIMQPFLPPSETRTQAYSHWRHLYANPDRADYDRMDQMIGAMDWQPRFSFVMPVYNTPTDLLTEVMDSMLGQNYANFEICVADDCSPNPEVQQILEAYAARDSRVKYVRRALNGHISLASNSAARLATGDYIVLVDHDDLIPPYTLFVVATYINRFPDARILFSDEDKISPSGEHFDPYFKSCYNEFLMYGHNMVSHLGVYHRALFEAVGGFRHGMEGSQDYDFTLRCVDRIDSSQIIHIPHILYHWRQVPGSTSVSADAKDYAVYAARAGINGHFERLGLPLCSVEGHAPGNNAIVVAREMDTSISIIIPTRNGEDLLDDCLRSIARHKPHHIEILIIDNDSDEPATIAYLQAVQKNYPDLDIRVIAAPGPFNFSAINNMAAARARGTILCFLNNDTEVQAPGWLDRARGLLSITDVGAVGGRLLYPDQTVQHFGIVTGMYEHAIAGGVHLFEPASGYGYFSKHRMISEFSAVTAACMFVRRSDFDAVGGFETDLTVAYNDVDLSLKLRAMGRRVLCDPGILLIHKESKSRGSDVSPAKAARLAQEAHWMKTRWSEQLLEDRYYSPNLSLHRPDFSLSYPPRQPWPWESESTTKASVASGMLVRAPRFFRDGQTVDQGMLAICAMLDGEPTDMLEWIAYHRAMGVEKFYLYDRNEDGKSRRAIEYLIVDAIVDHIPWPHSFSRQGAYNDFADRHRHGWTWAAFVDPSSFINPVGHDSITDWLETLADASAVMLEEYDFAGRPMDSAKEQLLIDACTMREDISRPLVDCGPRIVRMEDYTHSDIPNAYNVRGSVVDAMGQTLAAIAGSVSRARKLQSVCINHYAPPVGYGLPEGSAFSTAVPANHRNARRLDNARHAVLVQDDRITRFSTATRTMLERKTCPADASFRFQEPVHG